MRSSVIHVLLPTGDPAVPPGHPAARPHLRERLRGSARHSHLPVPGTTRTIRLRIADVEILTPAQAKRLRVTRKRDADRAAGTWRGPGA